MKKEASRKRPWLLVFFLTITILILLTFIILFGFIIICPPNFQIESISISFDNATIAKWLIAFSFSNPNFVRLRYRSIAVSVGGASRRSSTVATVDSQLLFEQSFHGRSLENVSVYVELPSPRPRLSVDGVDFDVRFSTEYVVPTGQSSAAVLACGDKRIGFSTVGGDEMVMVGGPVACEVVPAKAGS